MVRSHSHTKQEVVGDSSFWCLMALSIGFYMPITVQYEGGLAIFKVAEVRWKIPEILTRVLPNNE